MPKKIILFVVNHKSGNKQIDDLESMIKLHADENNYHSIIYLMANDAFNAISNLISENKPEIVVAIGGDGTVNLIASILKYTTIQLLIIPYGSANGMAKELKIPTDINDCLKLLNSENAEIKKMDIIKLNDKDFIHLADVGLNARIVYQFQQDKSRGLATYAKHLITEMFFLGYKRYKITVDDKTPKFIKAVSLTFANAKQYGTGAIINPEGKLDDGFFEICIFKPFPRLHVFTIALQMFRNRLKYSEYFEVIKTSKAIISCKKKCLLQFDGEVFGKTKEIMLEVQKQALLIILPANITNDSFVS